MADAKDEIKLIPSPSGLAHVFLCDTDDSGLLKEILLVKKFQDGTIYYVDIDPLHNIDKGRIKKIITSQHADKYECWELLSMSKLSNGMNALDFFHSNNVKIKRPRGARAASIGLADIKAYGSDNIIGSEFVNPAEATLDKASQVFNPQ